MTASASAARGTALVVVDVQNDFCAGPLAASRYPGDPGRLAEVVANTARAVAAARARGVEVVLVRFLGDPEYQGAAWRRRDVARGKPPKCLAGTWGAEFTAPLQPAPGEAVFTKHASFDAFLAQGPEPYGGVEDAEVPVSARGLERYLTQRGISHLAFAGLFADVCVDSTARTAFQKGFHLTVLSDCTTALHTSDEQILTFMRRLYGARVTTHDHPSLWARHPEEDPWTEPPATSAPPPAAPAPMSIPAAVPAAVPAPENPLPHQAAPAPENPPR
ncbi:cysteine hydrolase family protein [Streptomyces physcomitrii]|uniref:Cysteine hydrolase n=1 Tax=Streptomyces physcomitrii TaxID=2724184 RepID=A0ABX1H3G0_9ACTN|nr:cysteine hydrolase [Streptomyces physcomitrii]NKI42894.1 cysteine hydrolase [Streptomyces physcomitrii]